MPGLGVHGFDDKPWIPWETHAVPGSDPIAQPLKRTCKADATTTINRIATIVPSPFSLDQEKRERMAQNRGFFLHASIGLLVDANRHHHGTLYHQTKGTAYLGAKL